MSNALPQEEGSRSHQLKGARKNPFEQLKEKFDSASLQDAKVAFIVSVQV